jgi:AGCS family alanine or glycine:cation symporter
MQKVNEFLLLIDSYIGSGQWFVLLLLGTGLFFTIYLKFPQFRFFKHALRIVMGKYDKHDDKGDATHFQALATALSGTVGTGNIAGVALAIHLGGPAALFWMLITAMLGMTTKFVEVTLSHKYRDILPDGSISGGPMYYMKKRFNITLPNGKILKTGYALGALFAFATILSSFGTGSLPQINSISNAMLATFDIPLMLTGAILAILLALVILGGIKRIVKVTEKLVPGMALIYLVGALAVLVTNYQHIIPSFVSIFTDVFTGTAAVGGFLGAGFSFAFNRGVNRGLFSNEAGQGSAPIAHAAAKAHEPVSEGMVAILEPFIDTIIICFLTGIVLLSSGVWTEKFDNKFQSADLIVLNAEYEQSNPEHLKILSDAKNRIIEMPVFDGDISIENGKLTNELTLLHASSIAENVEFKQKNEAFTGVLKVKAGKINFSTQAIDVYGKSLLHSAPLSTEAFKRSFFGEWGKYIVAIGLLLFAFSTAISWSYYGERAMTYLFGTKSVLSYRIIYVIAFFIASFTDTTIIWNLSAITIALMAIPNLLGILLLSKEMKTTVKEYWEQFHTEHPDSKIRFKD